jgi:type III restriction enzyme
MKLKFDHKQSYQLDAIKAVIDAFKGQPLNKGEFEIQLNTDGKGIFANYIQNELGIGNQISIDDNTIIDNINEIQKYNNIFQKYSPQSKGKNFSIEMETGTGKTYVYLRTIFELQAKYGFKKFIVVVPSIAIREGVLKSIEILKEDFLNIFNRVPFNHFVYDSKRVNELRNFAIGNELQLMIINIDSFNKATNNVIHIPNDRMSGRAPIEFIQATNPIVILDEPQNMESTKAKEAINSLNPLCTLRYSATHKDKYNLLYSLDPVQAFQKGLVKKISVASILGENDTNNAFVKVNSITNNKGKITCNLTFHKQTKNGPVEFKKSLTHDKDLFLESEEREVYRNGFQITEIDSRPGMEFVKFSNGLRLSIGQENGGVKKDIIKEQIRATIKNHFEKELQVKDLGIKVLSLFFLDKVENYRIHSDNGFELGQYGIWFEEIYKEVSQEFAMFTEIIPVNKVHNGYFSKDKKGNEKNTSGTQSDDEDTYSLIMRDKEKLLSLDEPLKFIFSHSALREGWDNPNVFQICTLNDTKSGIKKRQEIGRGLRLPVNQNGERIFDNNINNLVVIANESYEDFASTLQKEFEEDCGFIFGKLPIEAFVGINYTKNEKILKLNLIDSELIWDHFKKNNWIEDDGFINKEFNLAVEDFSITLPIELKEIPLKEVIKSVEKYQLNQIIENKNNRVPVKFNEKVMLDPEFEKFWNTINMKTIYSVKFKTEDLIIKAVKAIKMMEKIKAPQIRTELADLDINTKGISTQLVQQGKVKYAEPSKIVPDILTYIQGKTELTRNTIYQILIQSKRLEEFKINPQQFMDDVVKTIRYVMNRVIIDGIKYEKLEGVQYQMSQIRRDFDRLIEYPKEKVVEVPSDKAHKIYQDMIMCDSGVERKFAKDLMENKDVKYFIKLPGWFKIDTPVGGYNPDWAIMKQNGDVVYMVRETKSTKDQLLLRITESDKIECGRKHFEEIGVDYDVATDISNSGV